MTPLSASISLTRVVAQVGVLDHLRFVETHPLFRRSYSPSSETSALVERIHGVLRDSARVLITGWWQQSEAAGNLEVRCSGLLLC